LGIERREVITETQTTTGSCGTPPGRRTRRHEPPKSSVRVAHRRTIPPVLVFSLVKMNPDLLAVTPGEDGLPIAVRDRQAKAGEGIALAIRWQKVGALRFPSEVVVTANGTKGSMQSRTTYEQVRLNRPLSASLCGVTEKAFRLA
jgi:hypothetical protein